MKNNFLLESKVDGLEELGMVVDKKENLMSKWNKESKNKILPAEKWESNRRNASIFSTWSYLIFAVSFISILPIFIIGPYSLYLYKKREKIKKEIWKQMYTINSIMPIPLTEDKYKEVISTNKGKELARKNVVFERNNNLDSYYYE